MTHACEFRDSSPLIQNMQLFNILSMLLLNSSTNYFMFLFCLTLVSGHSPSEQPPQIVINVSHQNVHQSRISLIPHFFLHS